MNTEKNVLLLTATIDPNVFNTPFTFLKDKEVRFAQYYTTVRRYIEQSAVDAVVLCDNSLCPDRFEELKKMAIKNDKLFEYISFLGDREKIHKLGKGFGEGEIIKYALQNSEVLNNGFKVFYKITGRIFIDNISTILKNTKNENCFLLSSIRNRDKIDTRFFRTEIKFFKNKLEDVYVKCNDFENSYLEDVYFKILIDEKRGSFYCYPKYTGYSGSDGISYEKTPLKYLLFNVANKVGLL